MLMRLRHGPTDDRSQTQIALAVQTIMSIRHAFLQRKRLNDMTILAEEHRKSIWNDDMKTIFLREMHGHDRGRHHARYRAWAHIALGDIHVVKQILAEGMPADVFTYICIYMQSPTSSMA